ncbi:MAG TPA: Gfo/Idh/MocA family oxidoreductase [Intrasporangium sp.]|uniref:Gfo/Idh/MocA family protein n=1 Tax=Intrasporangium sp. TaxID=1925024 RepID=UPI002D795DAC|nr:Gfo/Idh/MocA family oxidoreductase [Intrasporangium sp.]HET7399387.1 Gfo/Idh/MocA family oxidoreductase [Intrasporangium sp.]
MSERATVEPLRIGILGAARIAALSIVAPAAATGHRLVAVAVYNPLANSLHAPWNLRAIAAGKHVLSEKPFAANAAEARRVAEAAQAAGIVVIEAFHYPFHPLWRRVVELVGAGAVGEVQHVETMLRMPAPADSDPRWALELAGGATMDLGCYALHAQRQLGLRFLGGEPRVVSGHGAERRGRPGVDEALSVELAFPSGATGSAACDMDSPDVWDFHLTVTGSAGVLHVPDFPRPHVDDTLVLRRRGEPELLEHLGTRSSYTYQLEAFAAHIRRGAPLPYDVTDTVPQAELVDAAYRAAGFEPRQVTAAPLPGTRPRRG